MLSPSNRANDLTDKFIAYRNFSTLEHYLLTEPDFCYTMLFSKDENGEWQSVVYNHLTNEISLPKLAVTLAVKDIYEGLETD